MHVLFQEDSLWLLVRKVCNKRIFFFFFHIEILFLYIGKLSGLCHPCIKSSRLLSVLLNYNLILCINLLLLLFDLCMHVGGAGVIIEPLLLVLAEVLVLLSLLFLEVPDKDGSAEGQHIEHREHNRHDKPIIEHAILDQHLNVQQHVLLGVLD
jgi:hypothetical protein